MAVFNTGTIDETIVQHHHQTTFSLYKKKLINLNLSTEIERRC